MIFLSFAYPLIHKKLIHVDTVHAFFLLSNRILSRFFHLHFIIKLTRTFFVLKHARPFFDLTKLKLSTRIKIGSPENVCAVCTQFLWYAHGKMNEFKKSCEITGRWCSENFPHFNLNFELLSKYLRCCSKVFCCVSNFSVCFFVSSASVKW